MAQGRAQVGPKYGQASAKGRKRDPELLATIRETCWCERCGKWYKGGVDPHHIRSRGAGGADIRANVLGLCRRCHTLAHAGKITKHELIALVCKRDGLSEEQWYAQVWRGEA